MSVLIMWLRQYAKKVYSSQQANNIGTIDL